MYVSSVDARLEGCRLVLPSISVGNVGQLAADLLINSLCLHRVGYLQHPSLLPLVGNDAFDHTSRSTGYLHTSAEVFFSEQLKLAVLQVRAPIAKGCVQSFVSDLIGWIKESGFSEVVVLASSQAHERRDSQLSGRPFRFLLNQFSSNLFSDFTERLKWATLEPRSIDSLRSCDSSIGSHDPPPPSGVLEASQIFLPGSGFAKRLFIESVSAGVRMVLLVAFCSQGDNTSDGVLLVTLLDQWLGLRQAHSKEGVAGAVREGSSSSWLLIPSSWELMYGGPTPQDIF